MRKHAITFSGPGRTKQSFKDECDINHMLATFQSGGRPPKLNPFPARYGDFSQAPDLHAALNQVREAETAFGELPSGLRKRFGNDAGLLLDFMSDPENIGEAIKLGLIDAEPTVTETVTTEPPPPAPEPEKTGGETPPQ